MFYYTYITTLEDSEKYYVGRHQSKKHPDNDSYRGSGKWVRSIKDKSRLKRRILNFYDNEYDLLIAEELLLSQHFGLPGCMNMNEKPIGFSSTNNPSRNEETRKRNRQRFLQDNPMKGRKHTRESIHKMKLASTGKTHTESSKAKRSQSMIGKNLGKKRTDEQKAQLSWRRKREYRTGTRIHARGMKGKKHSAESISKIKAGQQNRTKSICIHCGGSFAACAIAAWHGDRCKKKGA